MEEQFNVFGVDESGAVPEPDPVNILLITDIEGNTLVRDE